MLLVDSIPTELPEKPNHLPKISTPKSIPLGIRALTSPGGSSGKESTANVGDTGSIPGLGRSPGGGNGNPLQCSCLEELMDRGAQQAAVHGVRKSQI